MTHTGDTHPARSEKCRQRVASSTAKAVAMLDLLIEFFADGGRWIKGRNGDGRGKHCLVGAMRYLPSHHDLAGARTAFYLRHAMINLPGPHGGSTRISNAAMTNMASNSATCWR